MEHRIITAVGIDVSKYKSMVAVRRPGGEVVMEPFEVRHTASELDELVSKLSALDGEVRVEMEHTGMYWRPVAMALKRAGFFVRVVNAMLIQRFQRQFAPQGQDGQGRRYIVGETLETRHAF